MADEILVDTSAWIQLFRDGEGPAADVVRVLLENEGAVITGLVAAELLRGARQAKEQRALDDLFSIVRWIDIDRRTFLEAGRLGHGLAASGLTIPTVDLVLAQAAINQGLAVLTLDKHFLQIAKHAPLNLVL